MQATKSIIGVCAAVLFPMLLIAQDTYINQNHSSGSQTITGDRVIAPGNNGNVSISNTSQINAKGRNEVQLKPGFHAGDFESNGYFHAFIDPNQSFDVPYSAEPISNEEFDQRTINTNKPVGAIPGIFNVSPTGAATYTIPIQIPSGTAGMQPSVALSYSSQSGNGLLGMGWNLACLSAITRVNKSIHFDGKTEAVQLDAEDALALDGQRLIKNGSIYRTEIENYSKIIPIGTAGNGPERFTVQTKNGQTLEYGLTANSRYMAANQSDVLFWLLEKVSDPYGNYIRYTYRQENNEIVLSHIDYTGNEASGLNPYHRIQFTYDYRNDKNEVFVAGTGIKSNLLLTLITVIADGLSFKTYEMNYFHRLYSYLQEVKEFGSDASELNSTIFKYGEEVGEVEIEDFEGFLGSTTELQTFDFNNAGFSDILSANFTTSNSLGLKEFTNYKIYLKNQQSQGFSYSTYGYFPNTPFLIENLNTPNSEDWIQIPNGISSVTSDFTGDGLGDILISSLRLEDNNDNDTSNDFFHIQSMNIHSFNGFYLEEIPINLVANYCRIQKSKKYIYFGDFDGDGVKDILTAFLKNDDNNVAKIFISYPKRQLYNIPISFSNPKEIFDAFEIAVIDFDGDGRDEIIVFNEPTEFIKTNIYSFKLNSAETIVNETLIYSQGAISTDRKLYIGDFNGDRKYDLLRFNGSEDFNNAECIAQVFFSKGDFSGFEIFNFSLPSYSLPEMVLRDELKIFDYNSDGKSDIMIAYDLQDGNEQIKIYSFNGISFTSDQYSFTGSISTEEKYGLLSGDFNGDSFIDELLCREGFQHNPLKIIYFNKNSTEKSLVGLKNGFGLDVNIEYNTLSRIYNNPNIFPSTYPFHKFNSPLHVVTKTITPNGIGGEVNIEYKYLDGWLNLEGKGFLGFRRFETKDLNSGISSAIEFGLDDAPGVDGFKSYILYPKSQKKWLTDGDDLDNNNQWISASENTYNIIRFGTSKRFALMLDNTVSKDYLHNFSQKTTHTYYTFAGQSGTGNLDETKTEVFEVLSASGTAIESNTTKHENYVSNGSWTSWLPKTITTSATRANSTVGKKTTFLYNDYGSPSKQTEFSDKSQKIITEFEYDPFGNATKTTLTAAGQTRINRAEFDGKGRFALRTFNPLNQKTEYEYDKRWGKPTKVISPSGLISQNRYDAWGRLVNSTDPTNIETNTTYEWAIGTVEHSLYKTVSTQTGSPSNETFFDALGRERYSISSAFGGNFVCAEKKYNAKGQVLSTTDPFYLGGIPITNTSSYDVYGRPVSVTNGTITNAWAYDGNTVTHTDPAGRTSSKTTDASGRLVSTTDVGGTLTYTYDGAGRPLQTLSGGTALTTIEYHPDYGWQKSLADANGGTTQYEYDLLGRLTKQSDPLQKITTFTYDLLGRPTTKTVAGQTTTYEYINSGNGLNQLKKVLSSEGSYQEFSYDAFGRNTSFKEKHGNFAEVFTTVYTYDNLNRLATTTYPSGFVTKNTYDANGYNTHIKNAANQTIFASSAINARGQLTQYSLGNGKTTQKTYDSFGLLQRTYSQGIQDLETVFDQASGNLLVRQDNIKELSETFDYDQLDRLTATNPEAIDGSNIINFSTGPYQTTIDYSASGNIISKTGLGNYYYQNGRPNAVSAIDNSHLNPGGAPEPIISLHNQTISYRNDRPVRIAENGYCYQLFYGPDNNRAVTELRQDDVSTTATGDSILISRRFYSTNYELLELSNGDKYQINYIPGGDGLAAIFVKPIPSGGVWGGSGAYYYVYKDHLGSIVTLTSEQGNVVFEQNFDAWGKPRNPDTWAYSTPSHGAGEGEGLEVEGWLNRGYTGHEMLPEFDLVNMNARLYDPSVGRFLAVDNYVQDATSTQGYNRYSYCLNNPLKYTDPSGEIALIDDAILGLIGGTINILTNLGNIHSLWQGLGYFGIGFVSGALSEYITPVGSAALMGAGNAALGSYVNTGHVDPGAVIQGSLTSAIVSGMTMGLGQAIAPSLSNAFSGIASPVLRGAITQGVIGTGLGSIGGGLGAAMNGGDVLQGMGQGALWGGGIGFASGAYGGFQYAKARDLNPWTGRSILEPLTPLKPIPATSISLSTLKPEWKLAPSPRGFAIEKITMDEYYSDWDHTPYKSTYDGISPDQGKVVSIKSNFSISTRLPITNSLNRLAEMPTSITRILHVVTPPGYVPGNWNQLSNFCSENGIILRLTHY
ncbi:MAG: hypothetical protein K1X82_12480 [Bacteroidia bacterium]|nr:hypothetical protein [Bacteroidia bacterium]